MYALRGNKRGNLRQNFTHRVVVMVVSLLIALQCFSGLSFAAQIGKQEITIPTGNSEQLNNIVKVMSDERNYVIAKDGSTSSGSKPIVAKGSSNSIIFDYDAFDNATKKTQRSSLTALVNAIKAENLPTQSEQTLIDGIKASSKDAAILVLPMVFDTFSADVDGAVRTMSPFIPIIRWVLGLLAAGVFLATFITTVTDLAFIGIPMFRNWADSNKNDNGKAGKGWVSMDAQYAIREAESSIETSGGYKNPYMIYFGKRVWTLVLLAFSVLYLVLGELGGLIGWLLTLGSGFIG